MLPQKWGSICADPDLPEAPVMDIGVPQMIRDGMLQIYLDSAYVLHPFSWPTPEHIAMIYDSLSKSLNMDKKLRLLLYLMGMDMWYLMSSLIYTD